MEKKELRKKYKAIRRKIPNKDKKSEIILNTLKTLPCWLESNIVALYRSLPDEVDTAKIISLAFSLGKRVCLPKTQKDKMEFFEISQNTGFVKSALNIDEPLSEKLIEKDKIDLIIIPLIAADSENNRLGFGGGYYDRYLKDFGGTKLGICFKEQISREPLPIEEHDIKLDIIITD